MACRRSGVAALTAWTQVASAFLIPADVPLDSSIPSLSRLDAPATHQLIRLPCSQCVPASGGHLVESTGEGDESDEPLFYIQGGAQSIAVNFTISADGRGLEVNGEPIYPIGAQIQNLFQSPKTYVHQISTSTSLHDIENGSARSTPKEVTGHGVSIIGATVVSDMGDVLIPLKFSIFELERQPVSLDDISVQLLKQSSGELLIMHIESLPRGQSPVEFESRPMPAHDFLKHLPSPVDVMDDKPSLDDDHHGHGPHDFAPPQQECGILPAAICRVKNMLEAQIMGPPRSGCPGRHGEHGMPHIRPHFIQPEDDDVLHSDHHGRPHHMRPYSSHHHHHHHDHHAHHFIHAFSRGLAAVMVPTMAGVAVGMAVSLIGLFVGRLVGFLWIRLFRGGRRGSASLSTENSWNRAHDCVRRADQKALEDDDDEREAPPVYEDAPTYEEAVKQRQ